MKIVKTFRGAVVVVLFTLSLAACKKADELKVVGEFLFRPGNVTVSSSGKVFATVHPLVPTSTQLIHVTGEKTFVPFPSAEWQRDAKSMATDRSFDTPLGVKVDEAGTLWVIDLGLGLGKTRLFAFDSETGADVFSFTFPDSLAPKGSFIQDLAVDSKNGFVYLADIANPGILVVNVKTKTARRFKSHASFASENIDMVIDGKVIYFGGKPARVAVNPITLSADKETVFYGAMNGKTWYSVSAKAIRDGLSDDAIFATIKVVGNKPISDGAATDATNNHYFTNIPDKGIDMWNDKKKALEIVIRDSRLDWADNVAIGKDGHLYIVANQLYKTPVFTGDKDLGVAPYFIYKLKMK